MSSVLFAITLIGALKGKGFLERALEGDFGSSEPRPPDLRGYVQLALRTGFPQAAFVDSPAARHHWLRSYLDFSVSRDAATLADRDPVRLRRYVDVLALNSASIPQDRTLATAAGIARQTAVMYDRLLSGLMLAESVPAWWSNRLKRLATSPKRFLTDCGVMAASVGVDEDAVMRDADILGRLLETFVASQLRSEAVFHPLRPRLHHLRTRDGRKVDLILEFAAGQILAIKVKAAGTVTADDARHLAWLRDQLGDRFLAGVVLHTGPRTFGLGERLTAAPISALWSNVR